MVALDVGVRVDVRVRVGIGVLEGVRVGVWVHAQGETIAKGAWGACLPSEPSDAPPETEIAGRGEPLVAGRPAGGDASVLLAAR